MWEVRKKSQMDVEALLSTIVNSLGIAIFDLILGHLDLFILEELNST
jgi:hypothetical protein